MSKMTLAEIQQLSDAVVKAWNEHNTAALLQYVTDDISLHEPEGDWHGKDEVAASIQATFNAFPDSTWPTDEIVVMPSPDHHTVAVTWQWKGTQTGPYAGLPATGKQIDVHGVAIMTLKQGLISELTFYFDTYDYLQQLGVVPNADGLGFKALAMTEFTIGKTKEALHL